MQGQAPASVVDTAVEPMSLDQRSHRDRVATLFARAFTEDPLLVWLLEGRPEVTSRLGHFYRALLGSYARTAECWTAAGCQGAALWTGPSQWRLPWHRELLHFPGFLRALGPSRALRGLCVGGLLERHHPREPHGYLAVLGVEPQSQGRGVGQRLLRFLLARCDRDQLPAYLETVTEKNRAMYERAGFRVRERLPVAPGAPALVTMWREPPQRRS